MSRTATTPALELAAVSREGWQGERGRWSQSKRKDGNQQWVYDGKPLYYFHDDKKPGDAKARASTAFGTQ